jgi:hypothetical protein
MLQFKAGLVLTVSILASLCFLDLLMPRGVRPAMAQSAIAPVPSPSPRVRWQPNRNMGSIGSTLSGGRRGHAIATCAAAKALQPMAIIPLVPSGNTRLLTTSIRPTLHWYTNTTQAISVKFILSDPNAAEPLVIQDLETAKSGIFGIVLPAQVQLKPGIRYRWTLWAVCPNSPASEITARSVIEVIDQPALQTQVAGKSLLDQAVLYAENGIWYDALTAFMQARQQDPANPQVLAELQAFLMQADGLAASDSSAQKLSGIANGL